MFPRKLYPGQKLTAAETNDLQRAVHRQGRVSGTGANTVAVNPSGLIVRDNSPETIFARISGSPTGSVYPWVEVVWDSVGSAWDDLTVWPGRSGTAASSGAKELAGRTDVPTDSIVELAPLPGGGGWGFAWGKGGGITTANVDTTEESTTTRLEFDQSTGIRVDAGATDADPDVVSLTFGKSITFVECALLVVTKDGEGKVTDVSIKVKTRTLTVSDGATVGAEVCTTDPTDCCGPEIACEACPDGVPVPSLSYSFTSKSGKATGLPDSVTMEYKEDFTAIGVGGTFTGWVVTGSTPPTSGSADEWLWEYDGGDSFPWETINSLTAVCDEGGFRMRAEFNTTVSGIFTPLGGPNSESGTNVLLSEVLPCDAFDEAGTVYLGTITYAATSGVGYEDSSVEVWLVW